MKNRYLLLALLPLVLTSCATTEDEKPKPKRLCPQVAILRPLERMEDYGSDWPDPSTLVSIATMQKIEGQCRYEDTGVEVGFELSMMAERGPRLGGEKVSFPYAISLIDTDDNVRAKEIMTAEFTFADGAKQALLSQPLRVFVPLNKDEDASGFRVLTGFQLTEEQLKQMRDKQPEK